MQNNNWSDELIKMIGLSRDAALEYGLSGIPSLCFLIGILRSKGFAYNILSDYGLSSEASIKEMLKTVKPLTEDGNRNTDQTPKEITISVEGGRLLRFAQMEARRMGDSEVKPQHMLLSILHDHNNEAKTYLTGYGITLEKVERKIKAIPNALDVLEPVDGELMSPDEVNNKPIFNKPEKKRSNSNTPVMDCFSTDLTAKAENGGLDPVVGREDEMQRIAQILCRRKKNNPILIGLPGVGKSAVVEGLAQMIVKHQVPYTLQDKRILSLDMASIVAGTQFRGQFENRIKNIIEELKAHPEIILFVDEIHTIIGAGSATGSLDAANMLKPALARGEIQCIGATTVDEYRKTIEKDGALERRFQKVMLEPSTKEQTLQILKNLRACYEAHHGVSYTDKALEACVDLTERYVTDRFFPDKAIDAMDETGSYARLTRNSVSKEIKDKETEIENLKEQKNEAANNQDYELAARLRDAVADCTEELKRMTKEWTERQNESSITVGEDDVAHIISKLTGIPVGRVMQDENERLRTMKTVLASQVISQDEAIGKLTRAITMNRLGLKRPNRPIGTFLFVGPTGVGKTHLVKCLSKCMFDNDDSLIRIDMSEYGEKYNTSRLIGAPPGYIGYEEGGQLTERVRRHPYSVVLLDEIEKAHSDVFNILLQVMDEGRMTDGNGVTVDFRNTIIVMTSNVGTRQLEESSTRIGFNAQQANPKMAEGIIQKALKRQFSPEFLNRLDDVIYFNSLTKDDARKICKLQLSELNERLAAKGYHVNVNDAIVDFLVEHGFQPNYGARSLKRSITEHVETALCEAIMSGRKLNDCICLEPNKDGDSLHIASLSYI